MFSKSPSDGIIRLSLDLAVHLGAFLAEDAVAVPKELNFKANTQLKPHKYRYFIGRNVAI